MNNNDDSNTSNHLHSSYYLMGCVVSTSLLKHLIQYYINKNLLSTCLHPFISPKKACLNPALPSLLPVHCTSCSSCLPCPEPLLRAAPLPFVASRPCLQYVPPALTSSISTRLVCVKNYWCQQLVKLTSQGQHGLSLWNLNSLFSENWAPW